jgi:hypothetical protein
VSFGQLFDGYCVIHAPFATAERRPWFEAELARVGVDRITVVEAPRVAPDDPRLATYRRSPGELSNLEAMRAALRLARAARWRHVVVMEDDVTFRRDCRTLWQEVEPAVTRWDWDVLNLHRQPANGHLLVVEPPGPTVLVPMLDSLCNFCTVFRETAYEAVLASLDYCFAQAWPSDFYYGYATRQWGMRLVGTSRNLAGQASFRSSLQGLSRGSTFYARFRSCRSPLEGQLVSSLYTGLRWLRGAR